MRSLKYLNSILTILAVLLTLQLWTTWTVGTQDGSLPDQLDPATRVEAAVPNAGAQRKEMIDQMKNVSKKVDSLVELFKSGRARVRVEAAGGEAEK